MGRISSRGNSTAYGFHVRQIGPDHYRLGWTIDFHYPGDRIRYPRGFERDTDEAGARRFARKHGVQIRWLPGQEPKEARNAVAR